MTTGRQVESNAAVSVQNGVTDEEDTLQRLPTFNLQDVRSKVTVQPAQTSENGATTSAQLVLARAARGPLASNMKLASRLAKDNAGSRSSLQERYASVDDQLT